MVRGFKALQAAVVSIKNNDIEIIVSNTEPNLVDNGFRRKNNTNVPADMKRADILLQINEKCFIIDVATASPLKVSYQRESVEYIPGKVGKDAETAKRRNNSKYFDLENLPQNMKFVAFGIDTMGVLGPEAAYFIK